MVGASMACKDVVQHYAPPSLDVQEVQVLLRCDISIVRQTRHLGGYTSNGPIEGQGGGGVAQTMLNASVARLPCESVYMITQ